MRRWFCFRARFEQLFAIRSEASVLRMLEGSPDDFIHKPMLKYLGERGVKHSTSRRITEIKCESRARCAVCVGE